MKQIIFASIFLMASVFALPFIFMDGRSPLVGQAGETPDVYDKAQEQSTETSIISTNTSLRYAPAKDEEVSVKTEIGGQERTMSLKEYIRGVLLGEMPASFPLEAVKAQAVAVRTLVARDPGGVFCDDPAHCMAWKEPDGGYPAVFDEAIAQTDGQVLVYGGEPILAVFFSTSSGGTESSADVWGGELPYLLAVDSPGEEDAPNYHAVVTFDAAAFWQTLKADYPDARESGVPFGAVTRSGAGGVITAEVGGVPVPGAEMRRMFGLNSTNFIVAVVDGEIVFETWGYGHRVGLSQYGACAMALSGADYREILAHYYQGTEISG